MNKTYTVLLVDDDPDDQLLILLAFERISAQYNMQVAAHGRECLALLRTNRVLPDLILLDLNMPYVSGFELLHQLKLSTLYRPSLSLS
ncbi:response regulator [Spirosoma endophyticum]|uniref:Response regulator receiver domain-containing protein n=1 Tax=Spirosoma endophyticum TaxID=662367 RepID=A0A1I2EU59_9BACT|nr:response regulator [Spirosoma endophyticum]SFE95851.1 Response regulator receiver domain-containing protein [Spirosoma endophyticum]